jgi:hypothetical protein
MEMQPFVVVRVDYANTPVFRVSPTSGFRVDVSNRAPSSFSSSSVIECPVPLYNVAPNLFTYEYLKTVSMLGKGTS